jgi:hypothetical protein
MIAPFLWGQVSQKPELHGINSRNKYNLPLTKSQENYTSCPFEYSGAFFKLMLKIEPSFYICIWFKLCQQLPYASFQEPKDKYWMSFLSSL